MSWRDNVFPIESVGIVKFLSQLCNHVEHSNISYKEELLDALTYVKKNIARTPKLINTQEELNEVMNPPEGLANFTYDFRKNMLYRIERKKNESKY